MNEIMISPCTATSFKYNRLNVIDYTINGLVPCESVRNEHVSIKKCCVNAIIIITLAFIYEQL